jgi:OOP family OmpA-OmpF porin
MNEFTARARAVTVMLVTVLAGCALIQPPPPPPPPPPAPAAPPAPPRPPAPPPTPAPAPRPTLQKVTYAADAYFDAGKAILRPEGKAKLDDLIKKTRGIALEVIIAVGHTDSIGTEAYNQELSERRANAVKDYLVSKGIEKNRVYTEGKGEKQPIASNSTAEGRAKNNRAEIEVVGTRDIDSATAAWKPDDTVPVFFATNRQRTGSENPFDYYSNQPIDESHKVPLRRGLAIVKVPPIRERGAIERPSWVRVTLSRALTSINVEALPVANPRTQFSYVQGIKEMDESLFDQALSLAIKNSLSKTVVIAFWARGLIVDTAKVLLDREMDHPVVDEIRDVIATRGAASDTLVTDLHVWRVGRATYACALTLVTHDEPLTPATVREWLAVHGEIVHSTIEIHRCLQG